MPMMSLDPFLQVATSTPEITTGLALAGLVVTGSFALLALERKYSAAERKTQAEERADERRVREIEAKAALANASATEKALAALQDSIRGGR